MEVPEIYEKIVRIEASAREAGARSKIAVSSRDRDVDPVGACVGMKGSRVQAVVQELRGEKIDIVPYDPDPARFVCNAIAPAEVARVIIDAGSHTMELIVPGREAVFGHRQEGPERPVGLAAHRLAHRHPLGVEGARDGAAGPAVARGHQQRRRGTAVADALFAAGWRSAAEVAGAKPEELAGIAGVGSVDAAKTLISAAARAAEGERARQVEEAAQAAAAAKEAAAMACGTATATDGGAEGRPSSGGPIG